MQNILGTLTLSKLACLVVSIDRKHLTKGWARGGWEGMLPALPSPALPKKKKPNAKPPPPPPSPKKKKKMSYLGLRFGQVGFTVTRNPT